MAKRRSKGRNRFKKSHDIEECPICGLYFGSLEEHVRDCMDRQKLTMGDQAPHQPSAAGQARRRSQNQANGAGGSPPKLTHEISRKLRKFLQDFEGQPTDFYLQQADEIFKFANDLRETSKRLDECLRLRGLESPFASELAHSQDRPVGLPSVTENVNGLPDVPQDVPNGDPHRDEPYKHGQRPYEQHQAQLQNPFDFDYGPPRHREQPSREQPSREQPFREPSREQPSRKQPPREPPPREQPSREQPRREQPHREQPHREQHHREQPHREQLHREQHHREQHHHEQHHREQSYREQPHVGPLHREQPHREQPNHEQNRREVPSLDHYRGYQRLDNDPLDWHNSSPGQPPPKRPSNGRMRSQPRQMQFEEKELAIDDHKNDGHAPQEEQEKQQGKVVYEQQLKVQYGKSCLRCMQQDVAMKMVGCEHGFCRECVPTYLRERIRAKKYAVCPMKGCKGQVPSGKCKEFVSSEELQQLESLEIQHAFNADNEDGGSLAYCPKCFAGVVVVPGSGNGNINKIAIGLDGPLSPEALEHYNSHRFMCRGCKTEFCANCKTAPYHLGYTCEKYEEYQQGHKCRFCRTGLTNINKARKPHNSGPGIENVCIKEECLQRRNTCCPKLLKCGHLCYGIKNEQKCLPCLEDQCNKSPLTPSKGDYCTICYVEGFENAPTIELQCGHLCHLHCAKEKLSKKWPGARIVFGFMKCAACKELISHPALKKELQPLKALYNQVRKKSFKRLEVEGFHKAQRLNNKNDPYYKKPREFAMDKFAYYNCFKCKKAYFGGMRKCEEAANQGDEKFDETQLICGYCSSGKDKTKCQTHGIDFIQYKCKYCCNISAWYCWGNTHFCDGCHKKQENNIYLNRMPMDAHPKCKGRNYCPLKIDHPPNGTEYSLGCSVCLRK